MIHRISANHPKFRSVNLEADFNVILADAAISSDEKDSRNGLGKSSLLEIIHFCLGANLKSGVGIGKNELNDWTFSMEFSLGKEKITVHRNTSSSSHIYVEGISQTFGVSSKLNDETNEEYFTQKDWQTILGKGMFGLTLNEVNEKYSPTFRMLIPYFTRRGNDAFLGPFEYFKNQKSWQKQVANSYLLGLSWEYARDWQNIKDQEDILNKLKTAAKSGAVPEFLGTLGSLEAHKLRIESKLAKDKAQLDSFRVHPQYEEIEREVNNLTSEIHELTNKNISDTRMAEYYEKSLKSEKPGETVDVEKVYQQVGIIFPGIVKKRIEDVVRFHADVVKNRKDYLNDEIGRLRRGVDGRRDKISELSNLRAEKMEILKSHGALDEYNKLSSKYLETKNELEAIKQRISSLKKFEEGKSALKIEKEELKQNARRDYDEREKLRARVISLFNSNSEALYNTPGELIIDVTENGFDFRIEIDRADSTGIKLMEIFCYDLMLAQLWAEKGQGPGFLIHDSSIFADVDERQIASAIKVAAESAKKYNFQYICCLNSDKVPNDLLKDKFDLNSHVRLVLKDDKPESSLFGFRF